MKDDPYLSADVKLRPNVARPTGEATVENPEGVGAEGTAILEGGATSEPTGSRATAPSDVAVPTSGSDLARAKAYFTKAGFEVHAPLGMAFSIGNRKSRFETFFGQELLLESDVLGSPATVDGGGRDLAVEPLPDEIREMVEWIRLPEPPDLTFGVGD
ncbi:hypothetical protein BH20ACT1_BH20ACT1_05180 [soil metagenome]|nr:hypothetical protein [Actinomycetota bacterium]